MSRPDADRAGPLKTVVLTALSMLLFYTLGTFIGAVLANIALIPEEAHYYEAARASADSP